LYGCEIDSLPERTQTARFGERNLERISGSERKGKQERNRIIDKVKQ
jgi:hypothetical protein